jgi:hypothetical protein
MTVATASVGSDRWVVSKPGAPAFSIYSCRFGPLVFEPGVAG